MKSFKKYVSEGKQGALAGAGVNPHAQGFQMDAGTNMSALSNPVVLQKLNAYVGAIVSEPTKIVEEAISNLRQKLMRIGLQFDESKSQNPFAYYTAAVTNSFVRVINIEKRNQNIRDDILEMNHMNPSYTRQSQGEFEAAKKRAEENLK